MSSSSSVKQSIESLATLSNPPSVVYQAKKTKCVPYIPSFFLNLLENNEHDHEPKLMKALNGMTLCGFSDLARVLDNPELKGVFPFFALKKMKGITLSLEWVIEQTTGQYLVLCNLHCISVDCNRRLIFDCGLSHALPLTLENFHACGITKVNEMRKCLGRQD